MKYLFFVLFVSSTFAGAHDFTLINHSKEPICELYVAADFEEDWGDERLMGRVVADNESSEIEINFYDNDQCSFDIKTVSCNGTAKTWGDLNLCRASSYEVK